MNCNAPHRKCTCWNGRPRNTPHPILSMTGTIGTRTYSPPRLCFTYTLPGSGTTRHQYLLRTFGLVAPELMPCVNWFSRGTHQPDHLLRSAVSHKLGWARLSVCMYVVDLLQPVDWAPERRSDRCPTAAFVVGVPLLELVLVVRGHLRSSQTTHKHVLVFGALEFYSSIVYF